ncbi:LEAF RUST 10 DISEASE-RESISTANCE LOCUS RECEPTOR-LIKE PROTEIN KINASE-like 2.1 [Citrus sinensis]|nr:LEAF RUST 10 DISEASE-RESISTANCE LOCUS RECEPTOR-LIKE PROTEIN KINASE-like 2.1 [Citrus sinensis]
MGFQFSWSGLPLISLLCSLSVLVVDKIQPSLASPELAKVCSLPFGCGKINAGYPFWGGARPELCGHPIFELKCENETPTMKLADVTYRVLNVNTKEKVIKLARQEYFEGLCPQSNTIIDTSLFDISDGYEMFNLIYSCPMFSRSFTCNMKDVNNYLDGFVQFTGGIQFRPDCNTTVTVAFSKALLAAKRGKWVLQKALEEGFEMKWKLFGCEESCSSCGFDFFNRKGICYCSGGQLNSSSSGCSAPSAASNSEGNTAGNKITIGVGIAVAGIVVILAILLIVGLRRLRNNKTENDRSAEAAFFRNYVSLAPKRYNYSDLKRITKSFSDKLGQGGYGGVYKGKLPDGRLVAVKVLKESKGNGEEFINEVASISRTSHVNIVTFLGFCYEKKKRALIYEFMPNGSLDQFTYDQESSNGNRTLEWRTVYQIAGGIARGLEYLHRGCNVRIVHFDIKPHNILLDEDFCPKISDFGLAKQSQDKKSTISMLHARGTIGYIAPEVFCRSFGGASHKSDVYSYGMMILEMAVGRKNADVKASRSSDIYFPNSIYKHIEPGNDFQLDGVVTEEEKELVKKMILVSLWCIQTNPSDRPSMHEVLEMLESSTEILQIPPKPSLALPKKSAIQSSRTSSSAGIEEVMGEMY